jgi:N-acetylglucosaminyldiphosphoundecaprenol N-acetyl-beta-D-mannosaminyltransferase
MIARNVRKQAKILGVKIDSTPKKQVLRILHSNLVNWQKKGVGDKPFFIATPNPEHVMLAQKDREFAKILGLANFVVLDGIGLVMAGKFLNLPNPENKPLRLPVLIFQGFLVGLSVLINRNWLFSEISVIKGRDLFVDLVKMANKKKWRVFFLGGENGASEKAATILEINYKSVKMKCADGPMLDTNGTPLSDENREIEKEVVKKINDFRPHLLFVGFGAPKQEKWVYRWLQKLDTGVVMVVGGTFDFIAGKTKLPPKFIEKIGLEWLYRLVTGGQKLKRIFTAAIVFPLEVFSHKFAKD